MLATLSLAQFGSGRQLSIDINVPSVIQPGAGVHRLLFPIVDAHVIPQACAHVIPQTWLCLFYLMSSFPVVLMRPGLLLGR
jgi:hypothetical protein